MGLCVVTVQRALRRGDLVGVRTGRRGHYWHVYHDAFEAWVLTRRPTATDGRGRPAW
jgi:hypothetical protein